MKHRTENGKQVGRLTAWCLVGVAVLAPWQSFAEEAGTVNVPSGSPSPDVAPVDAAPVPPPSGPYPAPMMMRKTVSEHFAPPELTETRSNAPQNWRPAAMPPPAPGPEARYPELPPGVPGSAVRPSDAHAWTAAPMDSPPSYRPLGADEVVPQGAAEPQQAQKMQTEQQSVKNTPASKSEPSVGRPVPVRPYPTGPGYGYGYPMPPGYGYPPGGYGYGYPPQPYGYPARPLPGASAAGQQNNTQAE